MENPADDGPPRGMMNRPHSTGASFFRFCPRCGTALDLASHPRPTCPSCGYVQYRNPVVGVAAVILEPDLGRLGPPDAHPSSLQLPDLDPQFAHSRAPRVLLGLRAPRVSRAGLWCLPCGYVEYDEDVRDALAREIREETGLVVEAAEVFAVHSNFHDPDRQTVGIWFRVRVSGGSLSPGDDLIDLRFVSPGDPGVPLAFPTDGFVLTKLAEIRYHS